MNLFKPIDTATTALPVTQPDQSTGDFTADVDIIDQKPGQLTSILQSETESEPEVVNPSDVPSIYKNETKV